MTAPRNPLEAWEQRKLAAPPFAAPAGHVAGPSGRVNYGRTILDAEVQRVRDAVQGERNDTLNVAALKVGRAVAGGHVDADAARAALMAVGVEVGLTRTETLATVRSGLRKGLQHPRDAGPDAEPETHPPVRDITARLGGAVTFERPAAPDYAEGYIRPGTYLLDLPPNPPPVWGEGETVLWAQGEALMLASLPGLGKTTLAGQLVRGRLGLDAAVLDMPVQEGKRVLWLLMDRPQQIARSILRQFTRDDLATLGDRLALGWGPPPADVVRHPELFAELAASAQADTIVIDSMKDAALKLTDDETAATYNRARQLAITAGVEVLELHHLVKRNADGKPPGSLADVYGSAWLTAGAGSVLVLVGESGDPIVKALHLKQPREPWGPAWVAHDHVTGRSTVHNRVDLLELLAITQVQTALSAAQRLYDTEKPSRAQVERARRQLESLCKAGLALATPGRPGSGAPATQYHPHTHTLPLMPGGDDDTLGGDDE